MNDTSWQVVKEFYMKSFGFPEGLIEVVANYDILLMCVSGSSNLSISKFFNTSLNDVESAVKEYLNFSGWYSDLSFNPYSIYVSMIKTDEIYNLDTFTHEIKLIDSSLDVDIIIEIYRICSLFYRLEDRLNTEWY